MKPPKSIKLLSLIMVCFYLIACDGSSSDSASSETTTDDSTSETCTEFCLSSYALKTDLRLPISATCDGANGGASLPLYWENAPDGTNSFALTMLTYPNADDEGDLSKANAALIIYDIPSSTTVLAEGSSSVGTFGINDVDSTQTYGAPCSSGTAEHEYILTLYALSTSVGDLGLDGSTTGLVALDAAISSYTLDSAVLDLTRIRYNPNNDDHVPTSVPSSCTTKTAAFEAYSSFVSVSCSDSEMTITSATGWPYRSSLDSDKEHVGIQSWIGRVHIEEESSWSFPLAPSYISSVTDNLYIHYAIGISVDGVPILHYAKEESDSEIADVTGGTDYSSRDTLILGEVDQCGAHAGNGEDYHYHSAPFCLMDTIDPSMPLAYMFDGIPLYFGTAGGVLSSDGTDYGGGRYTDLSYLPSDVKDNTNPLDECNAYDINGDGTTSGYVYYSSSDAPYSIGCFRGDASQTGSVYTYPSWEEDRNISWSGSDVELTDSGTVTFDSQTWTYIDVTPGDSNNNIDADNVAMVLYRQLVDGDTGYDSSLNCYDFRYRLDDADTDGSEDTSETVCR